MLSKKIHRLKKKIKALGQERIDYLFDQKLFYLNEKLEKQNKIILSLESKIQKLEDANKKELAKVKGGINLLLDTVTELEDYKEVCSRDISTVASAITELYNILNYMLGGRLFTKKQEHSESVDFDEFYEDDLMFDEYIDEDGVKKKKKVYH